MYVQKFDEADFAALTIRRRAGKQIAAWPLARISMTVPIHCQGSSTSNFGRKRLEDYWSTGRKRTLMNGRGGREFDLVLQSSKYRF